ncbi:glutamate synthase (NADPH/NADH) large chain [Brevibacterium sp. Mu109]|uniref:glutamate synthase large subunit n=1 Tax=Brevibacterium sp. Mu109 TaxID=1255669 RepID=UPI000C5A926E|nr:glutamate synthase large subunit [Brevibacterium sp. Mu109]SMX67667.1 glutamate synthase (NADPH/NADH) large chain [Brevibacterium sp. Mu109]
MSRSVALPHSARPAPSALADPTDEHDACGLAFVARHRGPADHRVVEQALTALRNMEHRGGVGGDEGTGDGAGITVQMPHDFLVERTGLLLPAPGGYAVGTAFLDPLDPAAGRALVEELAAQEGTAVLSWRDVPVDPSVLGASARTVMPHIAQVVLVPDPAHPLRVENDGRTDPWALDRRAFAVRRRAEHAGVYFPSLSTRTLVYKGMVSTAQLAPFYPDLTDPAFMTRLAIVHSRFSTNTFPSWPLAQPFRMLAHNGEINTVRGNRNWMRARESVLASPLLASPGGTGDNADLARLLPIINPALSDSGSLDEVLELLVMAGRPLPHAMAVLIPEAWEKDPTVSEQRQAFYRYHALLMEAWDGPACVSFTDGERIGAVLDRNGLRPARYALTDDTVVLASEAGVIDLPADEVVARGRVQPGRMFLVDMVEGRVVSDTETKAALASAAPYDEWLTDTTVAIRDLPERESVQYPHSSVERRQRTFGYTDEELRVLIGPMAEAGTEPLGAMGTDTPIAAFAERPRLLFDYFAQSFAQVTNPPLDAIREELVTSVAVGIGSEGNLLADGPQDLFQVDLPYPVIDNVQLAKFVHLSGDRAGSGDAPATIVLRGLYRPGGGDALGDRLRELCAEASAAVADGARFLVLSDRDSHADLAPIPTLLLTSAIHHHLIRERSRTAVSLLVEGGDVREVHHIATLIGFGASAVNPYLAMETAALMVREGRIVGPDEDTAVRNVLRSLGRGLLKVMSKMGISTVHSYHAAQTFEALGLADDLIDDYFTGTRARLGGIGLDGLAAEVEARHRSAYPHDGNPAAHRSLEVGGEYSWRREGPPHLFDPETVFKLQHSTRTRRFDVFREYTGRVNEQASELLTLRGLLDLVPHPDGPLPLEEVESAASVIRRFSTGAMSYGSLSQEAHETLAIAMNRIGGKSNTGEGGEDVERLLDPARRSAIKQVASGRFGVTSLYLTEADDIQIKMAQGAKPGEGGQLPPSKVYPWIARTRHATAGVGLISPPPHHDIYSIEDLAQLIHDLKRANPGARVHVKLVASSGVGTVASGVAKAQADVVLISGHDGGTGASPLNSLKHAGVPWELGLAEAQQTLVQSGLRGRVSVQVDGQLKTGRDVVIAALLGAEEFGFATAPLVVSGCIMMRVCHQDTCPVGVATQNPELRSRFTGRPEFVETFFEYIAEEVRELLAELGFRSLDEAIGRVEHLDRTRAVRHWKADGLDIADVLAQPRTATGEVADVRTRTVGQDHRLDEHFDASLIAEAAGAVRARTPIVLERRVTNVDRSVGTMLGHRATVEHGADPLDADTVAVRLTGSAGQSLGAFLPQGISLSLTGEANDYVGKGLSGGTIALRPAPTVDYRPEDHVIAGNVIGYGATSGKLFLNGQVGERFLVRNSGAAAVVEGIGDHGLEYMTGGTAVVLGPVGRNFAAGMSGGTAYLLDFNPARINVADREAGRFHLRGLSGEDTRELHALLLTHIERTGSPLAASLVARLDRGEDVFGRFTKLVPVDYLSVLALRARCEEDGTDPDGSDAWNTILETTHG